MKTNQAEGMPLATFRHDPLSSSGWLVIASVSVLVAMVAAFWTGGRHDYAAYMAQWALVLSGGDPWSTSNTYGPAYNLLAGLFALHPMLPKAVFVVSWQVGSWYLLHRLAHRGVGLPWLIFWSAALPFNPLFWSFGVVYGSVDSLVAALCLMALACRQANRNLTAAIVLAVAVMLKIYPIVFAPFLGLAGRRVSWRFLTAFVVLVASGFLLSFLVWGEDTFHSFIYNSGRGSKLLSIFRFLRGDVSP